MSRAASRAPSRASTPTGAPRPSPASWASRAASPSIATASSTSAIDRAPSSASAAPDSAAAFASLPPSVAAYHLAWHPKDGALYVTGPTISTRDRVYRIGRQGDITTVYEGFGRPQGLAVDTDGSLLVAEALAGASGIYRLRPGEADPELLISGPALVGIAVHPAGGYVVATADALYRCY